MSEDLGFDDSHYQVGYIPMKQKEEGVIDIICSGF